ncbi:hypothetical protein PFISCL1PPCAC_21577, partial [Pristionchus fissidentatus]
SRLLQLLQGRSPESRPPVDIRTIRVLPRSVSSSLPRSTIDCRSCGVRRERLPYHIDPSGRSSLFFPSIDD